MGNRSGDSRDIKNNLELRRERKLKVKCLEAEISRGYPKTGYLGETINIFKKLEVI